MSFFKKDYSAYPQPVAVTPDPRYAGESISQAVAEAIDSEQKNNENHSEHANQAEGGVAPEAAATAPTSIGDRQSSIPEQREQQPTDAQQDSSSQKTSVRESQQQKDADKLAYGIMSLLGPIVQEMDFNIVSVRKSQTELEKEIERLMAELQLFMASSAAPPEVEPAVQKLVKARRQIMTANSTLKTVQERVDRMHSQLEKRQ
ncbi:hypothetical protein BGZ54_008599 [Gamsiella multidivaricata]|nr:hypothetical protein BGZ54_008599 [Gamsiella multidivaricata]